MLPWKTGFSMAKNYFIIWSVYDLLVVVTAAVVILEDT